MQRKPLKTWLKRSVGLILVLMMVPAVAFAQEADEDEEEDADESVPITELVITARRLDAALARIEPSMGAASYTLNNETIEHRPSGETISINEALLQAPGVVQDGSGALHVRQSVGDLQYRINNVILPEGLSDLGETLTARIAEKIELIAGALPAQYGFQVGGIVNITTKSGVYLDGTQFEVMGGSHREIEPAFEHGGSVGRTNFFATGRYRRNDVGLAPPDPDAKALHDVTEQVDAFAIIDHIIDDATRASLILGASDQRFQVPNARGLNAAAAPSEPGARFVRPLSVAGVRSFRSEDRDDRRREQSHFAVGSWLHTTDRALIQASAFLRYSAETLESDGTGALLFTGLSQSEQDRRVSGGLQLEGAYDLSPVHTLRAGLVLSADRTRTSATARVLPIDALGRQTTQTPRTLTDGQTLRTRKASLFVQDEWRPAEPLTVNFGLRLDDVDAGDDETRFSPRINLVWTAGRTTLHAGYARYFLPAPNEGDEAPSVLFGTTGEPPTLGGDPLRAETDDYYDVGVEQRIGRLTLGLDLYRRQAKNLLDEGEFRAPGVRQAFNYGRARTRGLEFSATYAKGPLSAWLNLAVARGKVRDIVSNQFQFTPAELGALSAGYVRLSHDQTYTASAGASYRRGAWRSATSFLYGSGLRRTPAGAAPNSAKLPGYAQLNLAAFYRVTGIAGKTLELRANLLNVFDETYLIRDGTALGGGPAQWGPRRGIIVGFEQAF